MTGIITSIPPLVEQPPGNNSNNPAGLPGVTYTAAIPTLPQTWTGLQTYALGSMQFAGSTSGNTFLNATAIASGVLTLPAATDTLVGQNTVDTLTNKTLTNPVISGGTFTPTIFTVKDNAFTLQDDGDTTKQAQFQLSGITTATTRTYTLPDASDTVAVIGLAQTLTNKTLTAPTINGGTHTAITSLGVRATGAAFDLTFANTEVLTAGRVLTVAVNDAARTLNMGGNITTAGALTTAGAFGSTFTMTGTTTVTFPTSGTLATLANSEAFTNKTYNGNSWTAGTGTLTIAAAKTLTANNSLILAGTDATTLTFQGTDTYVGRATTDTLTNKTFDTAGTGNSFKINGTAITANTGTGSNVLATSPTLVTPALGTPTALVLTNATGLPLAGLNTQGAYTIVANNTAGSASPTAMDVTALTSKPSPISADIVLIQDSAASNAFKRTTVGALASAGSVSSIAGNTGAFTLANGLTNSTNVISQLAGGANIAEANGGCEVWQIGTSVAVAASLTPYCGPDRWAMYTGTSQASVVSRQTGIVSGSRYAAKVLRNSGQTGTGVLTFEYGLTTDEVIRCQGQLLALSFTAKAGANWSPASGTLTCGIYFGTGAARRRITSFTSETNPITGSINLTTTAVQKVLIASGAAGAAVTQGSVTFNWTPVGTAGADDSFFIDDVRLDIIPAGTTAYSPPVEHLDHSAYFLQCRQTYRQSYLEGTAPATVTSTNQIQYVAAGTGGEALPAFAYTPSMIATPTTAYFSPATGAGGAIRNASGGADVGGVAQVASTDGHAGFSVAHVSGSVYFYHYNADARLA